MSTHTKSGLAGNLLAATECKRQSLLADLFHALNQPLTTLRCSLELALAQPRTPDEYRETLRLALAEAGQAAWLASGLRELIESDDPGEDREALEIEACLQQMVLDVLPLAESAGVRLSIQRSSAGWVLFEPRRLRQALFYLLEYVLSTAAKGATVRVEIRGRDGEATLTLETSGEQAAVDEPPGPGLERARAAPEQPGNARRLQLGIARGILEAGGGRFHFEWNNDTLFLEVRLPQTIFPG